MNTVTARDIAEIHDHIERHCVDMKQFGLWQARMGEIIEGLCKGQAKTDIQISGLMATVNDFVTSSRNFTMIAKLALPSLMFTFSCGVVTVAWFFVTGKIAVIG